MPDEMKGVCEITLQTVCSYLTRGLLSSLCPKACWKCGGSGPSNSLSFCFGSVEVASRGRLWGPPIQPEILHCVTGIQWRFCCSRRNWNPVAEFNLLILKKRKPRSRKGKWLSQSYLMAQLELKDSLWFLIQCCVVSGLHCILIIRKLKPVIKQ